MAKRPHGHYPIFVFRMNSYIFMQRCSVNFRQALTSFAAIPIIITIVPSTGWTGIIRIRSNNRLRWTDHSFQFDAEALQINILA